MTKTPQHLLMIVIALGLVDAVVLFFPITALVLIYVILTKPAWFLEWVQEIYR